MIKGFIFKDSWLLLFIPLFLTLIFLCKRFFPEKGIRFPSDILIRELNSSFRGRLARHLYLLKFTGMCLVIMALARPMLPGDTLEKREGIAVVIVVDTSSTMLARDLDLDLTDMAFLSRRREDFKDITRLDASLLVAENFIKKRDDDLIGLVAFAASAYVVSPLTFDHEWLLRSLERIKIGMIKDGTAIGSGILSALNALKDVDAKSRVVILMTDGINNYGQISPVTAAKAARAVGVRVYTIGITSDGPVNIKSTDELGREREEKVLIKINEDRLRKISDITGGEYFRVKGVGGLRESYEKIDRLEKVEIIEKGYEKYVDIFQYFAFPGFLFFLAGVVLDNTFFRKIP